MSTNLRSLHTSAPAVDGTGRAIALVCRRFNDRIVEQLEQGARRALTDHGVAADGIATWWVPGALEVPRVAKAVAASGRLDAVDGVCEAAMVTVWRAVFALRCATPDLGCAQPSAEMHRD